MINFGPLNHGRRVWLSATRNIVRSKYTHSLDPGQQGRFAGRRSKLILLASLTLAVPGFIYAGSLYQNVAVAGSTFQIYRLEDKERYSSTSSIFKLKAETNVDWTEQWQQGLWSVEIKQPQLQIAREYTPLPEDLIKSANRGSSTGADQGVHKDLELWIRREASGEVSNYLHNLQENSVIEVRGPKSCREIPEASEIIFLAGGTGIAPALQLANLLISRCRDQKDLPRLHILWANRRREDCVGGVSDDKSQSASAGLLDYIGIRPRRPPADHQSALVKRLENWKEAFQGKLQVDYFIDEEHTYITRQTIFANLKSIPNVHETTSKRLVLVCGPDGFVSHFAGAKTWQNGNLIQGQVGGILKDINLLGWEVIKL